MQQEQVSPTVRELKQEAGFPNARVTNDDVPAALVMHHCKAEVRDAPGATIELQVPQKQRRAGLPLCEAPARKMVACAQRGT